MVARTLAQDFAFASRGPLQQELQRLMASLDAKFAGLSAVAGSFEESVSEFEQLGLSRLNDVLTPLASEAITRLQDITRLFGATSPTEQTISTGQKQFLIPIDQRNTYVPTPYIAIFATGEDEQGMVASRVSFNREVGILTVNVVLTTGSGTFDSWELSVSPSPSLAGYTIGQTDAAIAAAITALDSVFAAKAPIANPTFTGNPQAPNQLLSDSSQRLATTYFTNALATQIANTIVEAAIDALALPETFVDAGTVAQVRGATIGSPPHAVTTDLLETASATVALTPGANVALDWKTGINFTLAINQNSTLSNPANGIPGTWRTVQITQDANGTRTLAYGNQFVFPGGSAVGKPVIATGNGAVSRISIYCRTTTLFEVYGVGIGLAA